LAHSVCATLEGSWKCVPTWGRLLLPLKWWNHYWTTRTYLKCSEQSHMITVCSCSKFLPAQAASTLLWWLCRQDERIPTIQETSLYNLNNYSVGWKHVAYCTKLNEIVSNCRESVSIFYMLSVMLLQTDNSFKSLFYVCNSCILPLISFKIWLVIIIQGITVLLYNKVVLTIFNRWQCNDTDTIFLHTPYLCAYRTFSYSKFSIWNKDITHTSVSSF
jgi:hypothetical protein